MSSGILLSGGIDSIALAWWRRPEIAFTVDYGQLAARTELAAAAEVAHELGLRHEVLRIDCSSIGSGDMAGSVPDPIAPVTEWWPYRNQLLVTLAAARGVTLGIRCLMVGTVATDGTHADGAPAFYAALDALMRLQEGAVAIEVPAIGMSTVELVRVSGVPREVLAWAHSCHTGSLACGGCRGCIKHYHVMNELYGEAY